MVIETTSAVFSLAPERKRVIAVGNNVAVYDYGACGFAEYGKLVRGCVGDRRAVIIDDREAAYQAVIGLFSKTDDAARSFLATEFTDHHRTLAFGTDYDAAVTLFAYKNYVRAVNDHLLIVEALAHKNPVRLRAVFRRFVNGCLNALATADYRIEMRLPDFRLHSEGESSVLVGTLGPEAYADLVLRIIAVGPLVIEIVEFGRTVAEPGIACLLYTSPSPRDPKTSRMPSSA